MSSLARALIGPLTGALFVAVACSEPSTPEDGWRGMDDTGDDPSSKAGTSAGGSGSGGLASGGSLSKGGSGGIAGDTASPEAGAGDEEGGNPGAAGKGGGSGGVAAGSGGKGAGEGSAGKSASGGKGGTTASGGTTGKAGATGGSGEGPTGNDEFFGESRCTDALDFCDGFEGNALNSAWRPQGPVPTLETSRKARGARSAHFRTSGNGLSILRWRMAPREKYYGRMFVYIDALPTAPRWAHWTLAAGLDNTQANPAEIRVGGQFDGTTNRFGVGTDHGDTGDWTRLSEEQDSVPTDTWVCVEWMHDAGTNETRFWSDGDEHASLRTTETDHDGEGAYVLPMFNEVFVGWWHYQMNPTPPTFDVWIDEVAFDAERIGCTR